MEMPEISSSSLGRHFIIAANIYQIRAIRLMNFVVSLCLLALKSCLPKPIVSMLFSKWYVSRNSPGLAGSSAEWTHFASFILTSLGYSDASQLLGDEVTIDKFSERLTIMVSGLLFVDL